MVIHFQVVNQLFGLQIPYEQRARPFGFVTADEESAVVRDEQRVEEAILAHFESSDAIAVLQADQVDVHSVP